jgi:phasin family protein
MPKQDHAFRNLDWDVTKMWSEFKLPTVDIDALVAAQQKNFEALTAANKQAVEGFQAVAKRQAEMVRDIFESGVKASEQLASVKSPEERLVKQVDLSKEFVGAGLASARELAGLWSKSADKTLDIVASRFAESMDECKGWFGTATVSPMPPASKRSAA